MTAHMALFRSATRSIPYVRGTYGPVPLRLMLCGLVGSLPIVTAMLALSGVGPSVGMKVTAIVQLELGGAIVAQVPPVTAKSFALFPLKLSPTDSGNPDRLVTVTFLVFDGTLVSVPYASVIGATVVGIVDPVLSATA
jgi:hypothetical protein